jgi:adenylate cyclase
MEARVGFGVYQLDVKTGRLWAGTDEIRLTPKASAVLRVLVIHSGEPVSKHDLFASVWNDTVVSDDALTACIQELRKALGDDPRHPPFIETRHRLGYRFVAPLVEVTAGDIADSPPSAQDTSAIAVLPFTDMSPGRDQDYLCQGFAEELINTLARIDGFHVAARPASFQFRDVGADVPAIGRHLGVGTRLEGSVRTVNNRVRVTVQLIDLGTGYQRWSQRFTLDDVFAIQDEIAASVATFLRGEILSRPGKHAMLRPQMTVVAHDRAGGTTFPARSGRLSRKVSEPEIHPW